MGWYITGLGRFTAALFGVVSASGPHQERKARDVALGRIDGLGRRRRVSEASRYLVKQLSEAWGVYDLRAPLRTWLSLGDFFDQSDDAMPEFGIRNFHKGTD